jgi:hypothetical protein
VDQRPGKAAIGDAKVQSAPLIVNQKTMEKELYFSKTYKHL